MSAINKDYPRGISNLWTERRRVTPEAMEKYGVTKEGVSFSPYNFARTYPDSRSLLLAIDLLGEDLIGVEVGVYRAESFCTKLQVCKNIKTLYGVDPYAPYSDLIGGGGGGRVGMEVDAKSIDFARETALHYIHWSGEMDRAEILEMTSAEAAAKFEDASLDFAFVDSYLSTQDVIDHLEDWYDKVKVGGLFCGHDYFDREVYEGVAQWRKLRNIETRISEYDNCFAWIKREGESK